MRCISGILCLLATGLTAAGEGTTEGLNLLLVSMKRTQLVGELPDLRLSLRNSAATTLWLEPGFLQVQLGVEVKGERIPCRPPIILTPGVRDLQWKRIEPGAQIELPIGHYLCRKDLSTADSDWWEAPGNYVFEASASHRMVLHELERSGPAPDRARDWTVDSNPLELPVLEPVGVDAEALRWARQQGRQPVSAEVANAYPSSRYAALVVWDLLAIHGEPAQLKESMARGFFPGRTPVPDPSSPDGKRTVNAGEDMARWRIEQGERLLRESQDFPYERGVRLSVAVSYAAIGNKEKSTELLNALKSEKGTPEGQWAARFLALQGW